MEIIEKIGKTDIARLGKLKTRGVELKTGENRYSTFFFREYAGIAEKNTYSAYIPGEGRGLWIMIADNETDENFAKKGVEAAVEQYMKNSSFSIENINLLINVANRKIAEQKFDRGKSYSDRLSVLIAMIEDEGLIVGNIGRTRLEMFRENKMIEEVSGNRIVNATLRKNDYILTGSPEFWETINETQISGILIRYESKKELEIQLSEKVEKAEKMMKRPIPFLSIFIENLKENETEITREEIGKMNPLKYMLVMIVFLFIFVAAGKTVQNKGYIKKAEEYVKMSDEKMKEKKFKDAVSELDMALIFYRKINPKNKKIKQEIEEAQRKKDYALREERKLIERIKSIKVVIPPAEVSEKIPVPIEEKSEEKTDEVKEQIKPVIGNEAQKKKKRTEKKTVKSDKKESKLDKEIQRNWEILGRDSNGNKKK